LKKRLRGKLENVIAPIRERRSQFGGRKDYIMDVLRAGTAQAAEVTRETLEELKAAFEIFRLERDLYRA
jgi:tryptophanyl-tRNA synthetase